jgi:6-phospho-3-hexuloisomerase
VKAPATVREAAELVLNELGRASSGIKWEQWERLPDLLLGAKAIFTIGNGRSGLALRMGAMRLMHLGLRVHVIGETTTPAIGQGDLLLAVSGSGTTHGTLHAAEVAAKRGATVVAMTADASSLLAKVASHTLIVPGAVKTDRSGDVSGQYAGTLFEQLTLVLVDSVFYALWKRSGQSADQLYARHGNLE